MFEDEYYCKPLPPLLKNQYEIHLNYNQTQISLVIRMVERKYEYGKLFDTIEDVLNEILKLEKEA